MGGGRGDQQARHTTSRGPTASSIEAPSALYDSTSLMVPWTNQIHDFNPGISPEGVFWTVPIKGGVDVDFEDGTAEVEVTN